MTSPIISVIMAVYNCEKTVKEAIDSILNQTFPDFEFIICDDCSTDNTYQIVCEYAAYYPDKIIALRNQQNSKLAYALNHCLKFARGKYIARMDGDDVSVPERLQMQYEFLESNTNYDLVGTAMRVFDEFGEHGLMAKNDVPDQIDLLRKACFNHATILMKRLAYEKVGLYTDLPRTVRCEDVDLWFKFYAAGFKGYNLPDPLYKVRVGINDFKRRTFESRLNETKTRLSGYRLLKIKIWFYPLAFKPLISGLIPHKVMFLYHKLKFKNKL